MAFLSGSDENTNIDITVFPDNYQELKDIKKGDIVLIDGKVERRNAFQLILNKISKIKWNYCIDYV